MEALLSRIVWSWVATASAVRRIVQRIVNVGIDDDPRFEDIAVARDVQAWLGVLVSAAVTWEQLSVAAWRPAYAFVLSPFTNALVAIVAIIAAGLLLLIVASPARRGDVALGLLGCGLRGGVAVGASLMARQMLAGLQRASLDMTSLTTIAATLMGLVFTLWVMLPALWTVAETTVSSRLGATSVHPLLGPVVSVGIATAGLVSKYLDWRAHPATALHGIWSTAILLTGPIIIYALSIWEIRRTRAILHGASMSDLFFSRY